MRWQLPFRLLFGAAVTLALVVPGTAEEAEPVAGEPLPPVVLEFAPPLDLVDNRQVKVNITEILLNGAPTGLTAAASGVVKWSVIEVDDEISETTVRVEIVDLAQQLVGQDLNSRLPLPMLLRLDLYARLVDPPDVKAPPPQQAGEILSQGGLPLQALAVICALPQLPDHPVAVGESWEQTLVYHLPGFGEVQLEVETVLKAAADNVAQLESHLQAHLPDFEADNPLMPGQLLHISQAVIEFTDFLQEYDLNLSLVRRAQGKVKATFEATAPDMLLPVKLVADLTYGAVPPPLGAGGRPPP